MSQQDPYTFTPGPVPTGLSAPPDYSRPVPAARQPAGFGRVGQPAGGVAGLSGYGAPGYAVHGYGTQGYAAAGYQAPPMPGTEAFAIVALILSLVGVGLGAVIFGHLALRRIAQTGAQGRGMAIAGLIIGYLGIALSLAYVALIVVLGVSEGFAY